MKTQVSGLQRVDFIKTDTDIIEIPLFIKALVPEYKIYLSHKIPYYNSTVVFAAV